MSQRRVTFHLPDGSQESCSDSGLGDHEPVGSGTLISHPLPLVQPQDEFYDQASPDKRTEADGNSDPNSDLHPMLEIMAHSRYYSDSGNSMVEVEIPRVEAGYKHFIDHKKKMKKKDIDFCRKEDTGYR
ncbi:hypothetical protein MG293_011122 [Ovis ammon polii]|uniref:PCDH9 protein n=1 Tax=Ovis ammon polii TaxID=230172 RepID=A0AAD4Y5W7_OVIAM|nr:hypothetical protein MG293_011122 [Ovis ammon polii]